MFEMSRTIHPLELWDEQNKKAGILELFRAYQEAIDVNMICSIADQTGRIVHVNDKFCEISKYGRDELIGQDHRIINSGYHPREFFRDIWRTLGKGDIWHGEIKNKAKDGTYYWVETVIIPVRTQEGEVIRYLSLRIVITDRKNAEEDRLRYIQKLRILLEMTSHRLRSPLTTSLGLINILQGESELRREEISSLLGHLQKSLLQIDEFTKELTAFMTNSEREFARILPSLSE